MSSIPFLDHLPPDLLIPRGTEPSSKSPAVPSLFGPRPVRRTRPTPRVADRGRDQRRRARPPLSFSLYFPPLLFPFSLFLFPFSFSFSSFPSPFLSLSLFPSSSAARLTRPLLPLLHPAAPSTGTRHPWTPLRPRCTPGPAGPPPRARPPYSCSARHDPRPGRLLLAAHTAPGRAHANARAHAGPGSPQRRPRRRTTPPVPLTPLAHARPSYPARSPACTPQRRSGRHRPLPRTPPGQPVRPRAHAHAALGALSCDSSRSHAAVPSQPRLRHAADRR